MRLVTLVGGVIVVGAAVMVGRGIGHSSATPAPPTTTSSAAVQTPPSVIGQPLAVHRPTSPSKRPVVPATGRKPVPAPTTTATATAAATTAPAPTVAPATTATTCVENLAHLVICPSTYRGPGLVPGYIQAYGAEYVATTLPRPAPTTTTTHPAVGILKP